MNRNYSSNKENLAYWGRWKILMGRMALIPGVFLIAATSCTKSANALSDRWRVSNLGILSRSVKHDLLENEMTTYIDNESGTIEDSICLEFLCDGNIDGTRLQLVVYSIERLHWKYSAQNVVRNGLTNMLECPLFSESRRVMIYLDDEPVRHNSGFDQGRDGDSGLSTNEQRTQ